MGARLALAAVVLVLGFMALRWSAARLPRRQRVPLLVMAAGAFTSLLVSAGATAASAEALPTRLVGPLQLSGAAQQVYAVPSGKTAVIEGLYVSNNGTLAQTVSLAIGSGSFFNQTLAGSEVQSHAAVMVVSGGETIWANGGTSIRLTISGGLYDAATYRTVAFTNASMPVTGTVGIDGTVAIAEPVTVDPAEGTSWGTTEFDFANVTGDLPVRASNAALDDRAVGAVVLVIGLTGGLLSGSVLFRPWVR